jgi:xylulokinase
MSEKFSLGIDLGTTSVKVLALDSRGEVLAVAHSHHGLDDSAAGVQADPEVWWRSLLSALGDLDADLADAMTVGFSGNMSSVVLVDDELVPVAPALLLADTRGTEQLGLLDPDLRARIARGSGNEPQIVFSLSSLLWWAATDVTTLDHATAWLSAKDFLRARLTGVVGTDPTDAYNSLLVNDGAWDEDLIEDLGLPLRLFPPLMGSGSRAGSITPAASGLTGLPAGIAVAAGSGDVAAALAGMGGLSSTSLAVSLGTSATLTAGLAPPGVRPYFAPGTGLTVHPAADGSWFALGSLLTGGLALNWLRGLAGAAPIAAASAVPSVGDRLVFLPYLAGTGSPDFVGEATGTILGITPSTTPEQIVGALLEAIAFDIASLVDNLGTSYERVIISGGGGRVEAWPVVFANVLGLPVDVLDEPDLSAVGAAVLGWQALGAEVEPRAGRREVVPDPATATDWNVRRARYESARRLVLELTTTLTTEQKAAQ